MRTNFEHAVVLVCQEFNLKPKTLLSRKRAQRIVHPRQLATWLVLKSSTLSLPAVGRLFGNQDHTTVMYSQRRVEQRRWECPEYRATSDRLLACMEQAQGASFVSECCGTCQHWWKITKVEGECQGVPPTMGWGGRAQWPKVAAHRCCPKYQIRTKAVHVELDEQEELPLAAA